MNPRNRHPRSTVFGPRYPTRAYTPLPRALAQPLRASQPSPRTKRPRLLSLKRKAQIGLALVVAILLFSHVVWSNHVSAERAISRQQAAAVVAAAEARSDQFATQVNDVIANNPQVTFSVSVSSNTLPSLQQFGDTGAFDGASNGKLITAADLLHHVEVGSSSLATNLDGHSLGYWLQIMIVNSDDTAWSELNGYLGHDDLQRYAGQLGLVNYDSADNTLTSNDIARLLSKLYNGQLLQPTHRSLLLSELQKANYRNFIVPAIPSTDTVYHKIGLDNDEVNDAAIVTHGPDNMVLVIFTNGNGTYDWQTRAQIMQEITKDALAAFIPQS